MEFQTYIRSLRSHWKGALAAVVAPAVCLPLRFCPPWPDSSGLTGCAVAAVVSLVGLLVPYGLSVPKAKASRLMVGTGLLAGFCLLAYIVCWSLWVVDATQSNRGQIVTTRVVKGTTLAVPTDGLREEEILRKHGYRVEEVYTRTSLIVSRLALLSSFSAVFFFLTVSFGFTALQPSSRGGRPARSSRAAGLSS
jgi:hypothetical protein